MMMTMMTTVIATCLNMDILCLTIYVKKLREFKEEEKEPDYGQFVSFYS